MSEELAWAAGFFDGEGSTSLLKNNKGNLWVCLAIRNTDKELLERFLKAVGCGKVYGPYKPSSKISRKPHYDYRAGGIGPTKIVVSRLWEYIGQAKRSQITR